ncbi:hypothetical protein [Aurantivibrio infirmus]
MNNLKLYGQEHVCLARYERRIYTCDKWQVHTTEHGDTGSALPLNTHIDRGRVSVK